MQPNDMVAYQQMLSDYDRVILDALKDDWHEVERKGEMVTVPTFTFTVEDLCSRYSIPHYMAQPITMRLTNLGLVQLEVKGGPKGMLRQRRVGITDKGYAMANYLGTGEWIPA